MWTWTKFSRWLRFNLWYLRKPPWDTGVSPPELITFLQDAPAGYALDVGCGTGTNLLTLASHGWTVVGVDIAWLSVLKARIKLKQAGVAARVLHRDITSQLELGATFDLILDIGCYHSLRATERKAYRQNLARWLNPAGTYLIYAHRQTSPASPHGVSEADFMYFSQILNLQWREDSDERRPDGEGDRPATWARFDKIQ